MSVQARDAFGILHEVSGHANIDSVLSSTSKNPVSNKTIYSALAQKVDKAVTDLINYYTKSDVYNKAEVRELLGAINSLTIEVVATLPTSGISSTTIYFVGPTAQGFYDEYVYVNSGWVKIGDTEVDLSKYVTSDTLTATLQDYYTSTAVDTILADYYNKNEVDNGLSYKQDLLNFDTTPTSGSSNPVTSSGILAALNTKEDILSFDDTPTSGSSKPVKSSGIYEAFTTNNMTLKDATPTVDSVKPIMSGGVYNAFTASNSTLKDNTPISGSVKPITSGAVYAAINGKLLGNIRTTTASVSWAANTWCNTGIVLPCDGNVYIADIRFGKSYTGQIWVPHITFLVPGFPSSVNGGADVQIPCTVSAHSGAAATILGAKVGYRIRSNSTPLLLLMMPAADSDTITVRWRTIM